MSAQHGEFILEPRNVKGRRSLYQSTSGQIHTTFTILTLRQNLTRAFILVNSIPIQTFGRLSAKCAGYHVFESRQARYGNRQVGVGSKRGAELASHVFRCLIESTQPKENVILKIDSENAFNSINRQFMLEKVFEIHPEVYKYSHSAYSQPSFLFYGDSVIKFCEGTQEGDPESPALFSGSIQNLIDSLESKINLWYLG